MRLEKIVLDGFKSFADKTELVFDANITGIVGPNGCGKSNVVDAVKWVLGEQSVKSLRSDQMADVIFSGSSIRKPLATAEVTLVVSNTAGQLPIETDQVQISRRIYKSGESEYRLNNKICRLKDIRELFLDTGIGVKAYSIIEQGQVEQLLNTSKVDRRAIFEEAAGISKYKAHKKEAVRKLEHTEENLLRLADIIGEVSKQLRSIKLQATRARNYLAYTQRLKELQLNYSLVEFHKIRTDTALKTEHIGSAQEQFASLAARTSEMDLLLSQLSQQILDTENQINQTDNSLVSVQSKIEQNLQRIEFLKTRINELQERKNSAQQRESKLAEQQKSLESDLAEYQNQQNGCEASLVERNKAIEQLQEQIAHIQNESAALQADLEDEKSGVIDVVRMTAQLHNELQSISLYRDNLSHQKDRLADRAQSARLELENFLTEKAQNKARLEDIEKIISQLQQNLETKRRESEDTGSKISEDSKRLAHSKESRSALAGELAVLKDMESRREGLKAAVKNILANRSASNPRFDYIEGILADIIRADFKFATAVEAALEDKTDTLVINDMDKLLADTETIEKLDSRAHFLCISNIAPFASKEDFSGIDSIKGRLVEFVKYDPKYAALVWKLLGKTLVVDSLASAAELSKKLSREYNFVTTDGKFLDGAGTIKLGPVGKATGLISRKSRISQLEEIIAAATDEIDSLESQIAKNNQANEHLNKLCKDLRTAIYEANTEKLQVNSKLSLVEQNIKRLEDEEPLISGEIGLLSQQIEQSVQKEYQSKQKLEELETVNKQRACRIEELESKFSSLNTEQESLTNNLTDFKIAVGQICEQNKALKQTIINVQNQISESISAAQTAQIEIQNCADQSNTASSEILGCESLISELFLEKEKSQQASRTFHDSLQKLVDDQKHTEQELRQKRTEQAQVEQRINELKVELGQLQVMEQNLVEKVREQLQLDIAKSYETYQHTEIDWEQVKNEINELREKIEHLGNVNIDAIDQQDQLDKRYQFLSTQLEDLNKSKEQLQQLISRLNKQSREKFRECFEHIRINFQQLFRKLFGGGKADILLEDSEDILEAGIEIIAQPPGKETRSISLLSGGEKTMTAIALLFSIFKTKPSPFCFLDEVDAALDEANNERFNLIIQEFQQYSQFIIITHSKRTMSIADLLYGITMQTRGVSKKISVKFDEYESQEQPAAVA